MDDRSLPQTQVIESDWIADRPSEVGWHFHKSPNQAIAWEYVSASDLKANEQSSGYWLRGLWTARYTFTEQTHSQQGNGA